MFYKKTGILLVLVVDLLVRDKCLQKSKLLHLDHQLCRSGYHPALPGSPSPLSECHGNRTSNSDGVGHHAVQRCFTGQSQVASAHDSLGNFAALALGEDAEDGASSPHATRREGAVRGLASRVARQLDLCAAQRQGGDVPLTLGHGKGGEGLDDEVGSLGAGGDEGRGQGEDAPQAQARVEALRHGLDALEDADGALVARLDGQDAAGDAQDGWVLHQARRPEVGRDADVLQDGGRGHEGLGGPEGGGEVVLARLDGGDARLRQGGLQGRDVLRLGEADGVDVVKRLDGQAQRLWRWELEHGLVVELGFQVLEREGAARDVVVSPAFSDLETEWEDVDLQLEDIRVTEAELCGCLVLTLLDILR